MNLTAWLFCIGSLAACLGVSALLYPHAALDSEQMALLSTPQPMENFDQVMGQQAAPAGPPPGQVTELTSVENGKPADA